MRAGKMVHVVFGLSNAGNLKHALALASRRETVLNYADNLGYGPIDPPDPALRLDWQTDVLGFGREEWGWLAEEVETFWRQVRGADAARLLDFLRGRVPDVMLGNGPEQRAAYLALVKQERAKR